MTLDITPPAGSFEHLTLRYSEPHRHYHNQQHIADCLAEFDSTKTLAANPAAIEFALWFHDAVYNTRASDNEEQSANLASQWLKQSDANGELTDAATRLVLATKHHDKSLHPDASLMVDIDLNILGQTPGRFWVYEQEIRKEYVWVEKQLFASKRAEILENFLARNRIFQTEYYFIKLEAQARSNLTASVQKLRALQFD